MTDFNLIDSSVWLAYLEGEENVIPYIDCETGVATSVITLFEVAKKYKKLNYSVHKIKMAISLIKDRSVLFDVNEEMVKGGYAKAYPSLTATVEKYKKLENDAKEKKAGMWEECFKEKKNETVTRLFPQKGERYGSRNIN